MTITPLDSEVYSPSGVGDENGVLQDTLNSGAASADLADLLDDQMVALLAERARAQAAEGGLKLLGDGGLLRRPHSSAWPSSTRPGAPSIR